jgi:hypothetical protein
MFLRFVDTVSLLLLDDHASCMDVLDEYAIGPVWHH